MSVEAVNQFLQKVGEDPQLQEELAQALEEENDREGVTQLATKHGYDFTPDELWTEIQHRQSEFQVKQEAGELSEDELETVAGGVTPTTATTVYLTAGIVSGGAAVLGGSIKAAKW